MNDQNCLFEEYEEIKRLLRIGNLMVGKYQKKEEVTPSSFELYGMMLKDIEDGKADYLKSKKGWGIGSLRKTFDEATTPSQPNREIPKRVQLNKIILEKSGIEGLKLLNEYEKELVESQVAQALAEQREGIVNAIKHSQDKFVSHHKKTGEEEYSGGGTCRTCNKRRDSLEVGEVLSIIATITNETL